MGLFPLAKYKSDDDIVVGTYKDCHLLINECNMGHRTDNSTYTDFKGLIIKIQMKKDFKGKTILGQSNKIKQLDGFEAVNLEDVDFMKSRKVYSTDQVEARYLLTTAFMERLLSVSKAFNEDRFENSKVYDWKTKQYISASDALDNNVGGIANFVKRDSRSDEDYEIYSAFYGGYIYIFISTPCENFFDIDLFSPLNAKDISKFRNFYSILNEDKYYNICNQMGAILSIIDYLKLDMDLGL